MQISARFGIPVKKVLALGKRRRVEDGFRGLGLAGTGWDSGEHGRVSTSLDLLFPPD